MVMFFPAVTVLPLLGIPMSALWHSPKLANREVRRKNRRIIRTIQQVIKNLSWSGVGQTYTYMPIVYSAPRNERYVNLRERRVDVKTEYY
jgi:hypothetical protein